MLVHGMENGLAQTGDTSERGTKEPSQRNIGTKIFIIVGMMAGALAFLLDI